MAEVANVRIVVVLLPISAETCSIKRMRTGISDAVTTRSVPVNASGKTGSVYFFFFI